MTQEIKNFNNLDEAINNYQIKVECETEPKRWWMFVSYKERIYYDQSQYDPRENAVTKETMIKNIRDEAKIIDRDEKFKKELERLRKKLLIKRKLWIKKTANWLI